MTSFGVLGQRPVNLPKDAAKLSKLKGDADKGTVPDFLFTLSMFFDAQPHAYDPVCNQHALRMRLVVIMGCFPTGSVALVWFRSMYRQGLFTSCDKILELFTVHFEQSASDLVGLPAKWEDAR